MCLTAEALALFLTLVAVDHVTIEPGRIIVHATLRDAHWIAVEDRWCTMAPQIDRIARSAARAE